MKTENICANCGHNIRNHQPWNSQRTTKPKNCLTIKNDMKPCPCKKFVAKIVVESISGKDLVKDKDYQKRIRKFQTRQTKQEKR